MVRASRTENVVTGLAVCCALLASAFVLFGPMYATKSTVVGSRAEGTTVATSGALAVNGWDILPAVLIPVLLAAMPLMWQRHPTRGLMTAICTLVLFGFCILAGFSIGLFYLPTVLIMLIGSIVSRVQRRRHKPA